MIEQFHTAFNTIWPFLVVLGIVVFVHEYGHYWVARRCGVKVEEFSIGFGRELFGWNDSHGTRWKVCLLPLGGYVKMFGDSDPASRPGDAVKTMTDEEKKVSFFHQSVNKRMAVVFAGPATNYLFAIVVLAFLFVCEGQPYSAPRADTIIENSAAAEAGIQVGDVITSIDGQTIERFEDIRRIIALNPGTEVHLTLERQGKPMTLSLTPKITVMKDRFGSEHKIGRIGIATEKLDHRKLSVPGALGAAVTSTVQMTTDTLKAVGQMIMGLRGTEELGGPLRIAKMSSDVAQDGAMALIWFMAVISVNLGLINLFPVPLLDGGHLVYYMAEKIRGRPLGEKVQEFGFRIGFALVGALMIFATWNDLVRMNVVAYVVGLFS